jgi:hypothetical protein
VQNKYETEWEYSGDFHPGVSDVLNEGFPSGSAPASSGVEIPKGTSRTFSPSDRMLFLDPKFQHDPTDPTITRWSVSELLDSTYMYRTFQYKKAAYAVVTTPSANGLV